MGNWLRTAVRCLHLGPRPRNAHVVVLDLGHFLEARTWPVPPVFPHRTKVDAHSLATSSDTRRNAICTNLMYNIIYQGMGRRFIISATDFHTLFFSRPNFLDIRFISLPCCLFSERFPFAALCIQRPDQVFSFASLGGLHVGHLKTDTASRLRAGILGWVFFFP